MKEHTDYPYPLSDDLVILVEKMNVTILSVSGTSSNIELDLHNLEYHRMLPTVGAQQMDESCSTH